MAKAYDFSTRKPLGEEDLELGMASHDATHDSQEDSHYEKQMNMDHMDDDQGARMAAMDSLMQDTETENPLEQDPEEGVWGNLFNMPRKRQKSGGGGGGMGGMMGGMGGMMGGGGMGAM